MFGGGQRRHNDLSQLIGFDSVGQLAQVFLFEQLFPHSHVERVLVRQFQRLRVIEQGRHGVTIPESCPRDKKRAASTTAQTRESGARVFVSKFCAARSLLRTFR
jgi:hypothetical protein